MTLQKVISDHYSSVFNPEGNQGDRAASNLRSRLASQPEALLAALGRLLASSSGTKLTSIVDLRPVDSPSADASISPTRPLQTTPAASKLLSLVALILKYGLDGSASASSSHHEMVHNSHAKASALSASFAHIVLSIPGGCDQLSEDIKVSVGGQDKS